MEWYEEPIIKFILSMKYPYISAKKTNREVYKEICDNFEKEFKKLLIDKNTKLEEVITILKDKEAELFENNKILMSNNIAQLTDLFQRLQKSYFLYCEGYDNIIWFRIQNNVSPAEISRDRMYHLPYDLFVKRDKNNERFKSEVYPALYLSESVEEAWRECGKPMDFYVQKFRFKRKMDTNPFYCISPIKFVNEVWKLGDWHNERVWNKIVSYIMCLPLILCCSIQNKVDEKLTGELKNSVNPYEMSCLLINSHAVDSVIYSSCKEEMTENVLKAYYIEQSTNERPIQRYNFAIFATDTNKQKQYSEKIRSFLCEKFDKDMPHVCIHKDDGEKPMIRQIEEQLRNQGIDYDDIFNLHVAKI